MVAGRALVVLRASMRPTFVLLASDKNGKVLFHWLYYREGNARKAYKRFQRLNSDGSRTVLLEDGRQEAISPAADVNADLRSLTILWTKPSPSKTSLLDTTPDEFEEISHTNGPSDILKEIADLERAYYEDSHGARGDAVKRRYLPRFALRWF
jgi:hypothetical protein